MANFRTSDGLTLHYTDEGAGTAVLCLSGLTRSGEDFSYMTRHLPAARLIKLDYRGRGKSDWAEDYTTYSVARELQDALELLDHLGLARVAVIGTSRGGLIAMIMAATARDRLAGACLVDIGPEVEAGGLANIMQFLGRPPAWKTLAEAAAARRDVMPGFANVPDSRWREEVEKFYHQTPDGLILAYDPHLRDAVLETGETGAPDLWPFFDALKGLPVAAIRGANSDILSAMTLARMQDRLPGLIAATVPDRGHVPFLDEPEAVAALRQWMDAL